MGDAEYWGPRAHPDLLTNFFQNILVRKRLIDFDPVKIVPTWRNKRVGEERVSKRVDIFFVSECLLERDLQFNNRLDLEGS